MWGSCCLWLFLWFIGIAWHYACHQDIWHNALWQGSPQIKFDYNEGSIYTCRHKSPDGRTYTNLMRMYKTDETYIDQGNWIKAWLKCYIYNAYVMCVHICTYVPELFAPTWSDWEIDSLNLFDDSSSRPRLNGVRHQWNHFQTESGYSNVDKKYWNWMKWSVWHVVSAYYTKYVHSESFL